MLDEIEDPTRVPQVGGGSSCRSSAAMAPLSRMERATRWAGIAGYSVCGAVAVATPLMLWMTWSPEVYYLVLLAGFLACCGIVLLSKYLPEYRDEEIGRGRRRR